MARKKLSDTLSKQLFPDEQGDLFEKSYLEEIEERRNRSVECLGMTFPNDEERRKHFLGILHEKLKDPEFRKIEGFPIGSDEDILALSDPPFYTACPNPFIADFIKHYGKPYLPAEASAQAGDPSKPYSREPFAADVSEGKNDPIYNAHSYHTKVPHKAIMRYILHYTEPGDVVFDGFCGTGMTGVAAQMCGEREVVTSLGYQVKPNGTILQEEIDEVGKKVWREFSKLGVRRSVLNDLSPAATFIAYNYNTPVDVAAFEKEAKRILKEVEEEYGWMYETLHTDGKTKGKINYTWTGIEPESVGYAGENTVAAILAAHSRKISLGYKRTAKPFQEIIVLELKKMGLIEEFKVNPISEQRQEYEVKVRTKGSKDWVDLPDVGFGVSQVLPVLVQCFYAPQGAIILMEQPEIHLHPNAQAALADVMIDVIHSREKNANRNIQLIIETHSEHFLRRLQRRIAEDVVPQEKVSAYFANITKTPATLEPLQIDLFGNIQNWPDNFFGDEMGDITEQAKAVMKKRMRKSSSGSDVSE